MAGTDIASSADHVEAAAEEDQITQKAPLRALHWTVQALDEGIGEGLALPFWMPSGP